MSIKPQTGEIWAFTSNHDNAEAYFLVGDILPRDRERSERVTLILVCDTSPENRWRKHNVTNDSPETMVVSRCWRRVS